MRARFFSMSFIAICLMTSISLSAQFDDLYYDYKKDETVKNEDVTLTETRYSDNDSDYYKGSDYDSDEYDNYDEYSYSDRIRRFHRPVQNYSSFDNWYSNYYYDPYYSNSGVNVFIGTGWGWNSWNRPWSYSYYNNPWGWNSWNSGWGYNSWNNPWGYNSWNSGWGWNSYGYCGNSGWGNNYYGNVYYGNGWNGSNWNNNTEYSNKVYGSRKGGSLSSSTKGRDASPRRIISGGSNDLNVDKANANIETSSRSQRTDRTFKGDIKSASGNNTDESVRRTDRSRIYSNPSNVNLHQIQVGNRIDTANKITPQVLHLQEDQRKDLHEGQNQGQLMTMIHQMILGIQGLLEVVVLEVIWVRQDLLEVVHLIVEAEVLDQVVPEEVADR